jgi:hypothetical protein
VARTVAHGRAVVSLRPVEVERALVDAAARVARGDGERGGPTEVPGGRADPGRRRERVIEHDGQREEARPRLPALGAWTGKLAADADPQRLGAVRLTTGAGAAEIHG